MNINRLIASLSLLMCVQASADPDMCCEHERCEYITEDTSEQYYFYEDYKSPRNTGPRYDYYHDFDNTYDAGTATLQDTDEFINYQTPNFVNYYPPSYYRYPIYAGDRYSPYFGISFGY